MFSWWDGISSMFAAHLSSNRCLHRLLQNFISFNKFRNGLTHQHLIFGAYVNTIAPNIDSPVPPPLTEKIKNVFRSVGFTLKTVGWVDAYVWSERTFNCLDHQATLGMPFNKYSRLAIFFAIEGISKTGLSVNGHGKFCGIVVILQTVVPTSHIPRRPDHSQRETDLDRELGGCISLYVDDIVPLEHTIGWANCQQPVLLYFC